MAATPVVFFRGAATVTLTTLLATVTTGKTANITSIWVTNTAATPATFDLALDDVKIAAGVAIAANAMVEVSTKQVLGSTKTIKGGASAATVNFHICGVEI